ncbi:tyrosine-type recombinase/integrase [Nonomuraea rubra]|uniref:tyrosine-type recombinase/integrase n=1 Tax=Nonomuraea rubra TaxID=46180 RepID=UPI0016121C8D
MPGAGRERTEDRRQDHDLVFAAKLATPVERTEDWKPRIGSCGRPSSSRPGVRDVRVHDARHTAATLLIEQGVNLRVVQQVLGHTRATTTERYTNGTFTRPHGKLSMATRILYVHEESGMRDRSSTIHDLRSDEFQYRSGSSGLAARSPPVNTS